MPAFIPIYCDFGLQAMTSMQHGLPVHLEVGTSLARITMDGGIPPTFPYTLPGTSAGELQDDAYISRPTDVAYRESYRRR